MLGRIEGGSVRLIAPDVAAQARALVERMTESGRMPPQADLDALIVAVITSEPVRAALALVDAREIERPRLLVELAQALGAGQVAAAADDEAAS